jgi:hypothetical protein
VRARKSSKSRGEGRSFTWRQPRSLHRVNGVIAISVLLISVLLLGVVGCGNDEAVIRAGKAIKDGFHVPLVIPHIAEDTPTIVIGLANSSSESTIRSWLVKLYGEDAAGRVVTQGICAGMDELKDFSGDQGANNWGDFLRSYIRTYATSLTLPDALDRVNSVLNVWDLAQVSPQAARVYWNACIA